MGGGTGAGGGAGGSAMPPSVGGATGAPGAGRAAPPEPVEPLPPPEPVELPPVPVPGAEPVQVPISFGLQVKPAPHSLLVLHGSCQRKAQVRTVRVVHSGSLGGGPASQGVF